MINRIRKMVYYNLVKTTINTANSEEIIINKNIGYYNISKSIVSDRCSIDISNF